jgi:hypothetical protein
MKNTRWELAGLQASRRLPGPIELLPPDLPQPRRRRGLVERALCGLGAAALVAAGLVVIVIGAGVAGTALATPGDEWITPRGLKVGFIAMAWGAICYGWGALRSYE